MLPEERARVRIDKQLSEAGWDIVARNEYVPKSAAAVKEALMQGNTESDYLLFVDDKAIAVVEGAVLGRKLGHRQRTQFINAHGGIMIFRRALHFLCRVAPRGICVNDGVFFDSYSPFLPPATASRACSMRWAAMV